MIRILGFIDVDRTAASYVLKFVADLKDVLPGVREIVLREFDGEAFEDTETLKGWNNATALLKRLKNEVGQFLGHRVELDGARIVSLVPGGCVPWGSADGAPDFRRGRLYINLTPNPAAWLYSGGSSAILWPGQVAHVDQHVLNSMMNLGRKAVAYLVVDVRVPPPPALPAPIDLFHGED